MMKNRLIILLVLAGLTAGCSSTRTARQTLAMTGESPAQTAARLKWWREARFGMFIHWGPVALKGTEIGWSRGKEVPEAEYDALYRAFNPTNFSADAWARTARDAGMKYLVLTAKHHDGFCLWDSRHTDYDIMASPFGRDVVRELAAACRRHGLKFCLYYSLCDWWHPDYPLGSPGGKSRKPSPNMARYTDYLKNQLAELLVNYGPLGILWFDGEWEEPWTSEAGFDLYQYLRHLQPDLIINNRVTKGRAGMAGGSPKGVFAGDYDTPEQQVGKYQDGRPWETCMTIARQWAWKPDDDMKSLSECLRTLVRCAGGDGNLLFNVGPMPDGQIEPRQVERLQEMGAWLRQFGDTVYRTRGGPYLPSRQLASTRRGASIYLHVFDWGDGVLRVPALPKRIRRVTALTGGRVEWQILDGLLTLSLPAEHRHPIDTILKIELAGSAMDLAPFSVSSASLVNGKPATASNVYRQSPAYGPTKAIDDDPHTRWATDQGITQAWLEVDLGQETAFNRLFVDEAYPGRIRRFELQVWREGVWVAVFAGAAVGAEYQADFPETTARKVRFHILEAADGPTLNEFKLFRARPPK